MCAIAVLLMRWDADGILEDSVMKVSYSVEDPRRAIAEYRRVKSVTKAVRNLKYSAVRTLYAWILIWLRIGWFRPSSRSAAHRLQETIGLRVDVGALERLSVV